MMMLGDKKRIVQVILGERAKAAPVETNVPKGIESDFSDAKTQLADELMGALKENDASKFAMALSQFITLASKEGEYSEEE